MRSRFAVDSVSYALYRYIENGMSSRQWSIDNQNTCAECVLMDLRHTLSLTLAHGLVIGRVGVLDVEPRFTHVE